MVRRRLPVGAELMEGAGVEFRVWAPRHKRVEVVFEAIPGEREDLAVLPPFELEPEDGGYHSGTAEAAQTGMLYRFRLGEGDSLYPDPASRFQPLGPQGPSQIIDPSRFAWTDQDWRGKRIDQGQVIYEMHIGTFTREGTWESATSKLPALAELGVTLLEVMPVAEFPGRFGWGYDGVDLFAPFHGYGAPDALRAFVDRAHSLGIGVLLDVVYNHLGPNGNYLKQFAEDYFTDRHKNDWGDAIRFDGEGVEPVREFFLTNAEYWIDEFHMDGLRLDATQAILDDSDEHILASIVKRVRKAARGRDTVIVGENEPQHSRLVRPVEAGGFGLDCLWNDDFHHSAVVNLTGRNEAYYTDYLGKPQEFLSALKWGYLYQGQRYSWQKARRGTPALDVEPYAFVTFIENHDQLANTARGWRMNRLSRPGQLRAMTALLLLGPGTPMLFQGQEFGASSPFYYFADHEGDLANQVMKGRGKFLKQFRSLATKEVQARLTRPHARETFERSKLDWSERERHTEALALHADLLRLRRTEPVLQCPRRGDFDGAVLSPDAFLLRYFGESGGDRLLVVNFGADLWLNPAPEPLLAPPEETGWNTLWSSEDPRYGGCGTAPVDTEKEGWRIPGCSAVFLRPNPKKKVEDGMERAGGASDQA